MTESGIYMLVNRTNEKKYIGQSRNLNKRKNTHFWLLRKNRHFNPHLQRAWNKGELIEFEIVEKCSEDALNDREVFWISKYDTMRQGYNLCKGGDATEGYHFTEEQKQKISKANKGKKTSRETIEKRKKTLREHMKDETFAKRLTEVRKQQAKERGFGGYNRGIPCSEEKKALLSEKLKGRVVSEEHKNKLKELYSGENSITAKLKKSDVVDIRYRFLCGESQASIRRDYPDISKQTIYDIARCRRWKSVPNTKEELEEIKWNQETSAQDK